MMEGTNRPNRRLRCAIYTRKSTEEGLDMEFNTLDAQREACEAYIASQRSEGCGPGASLRKSDDSAKLL